MKFGLKKVELRLLLWVIPLVMVIDFCSQTRSHQEILNNWQNMPWPFQISVGALLLLIIWLMCGRPEKLTMLLRIMAFFWYLAIGTATFVLICAIVAVSRIGYY